MKAVRRIWGVGPKPVALLLWIAGMLTSPRASVAQEVGEVFRDCNVCPDMVVVPAGSFMMGSPETEEGRDDDEGPQYRVNIEYVLAVGVYEVTFDEWDACVRRGGCEGYEPEDEGWGRGRRPVIHVSWEDAWRYADWLAEETGEDYRLLGEAEWEYVARAGTGTARYWGETVRVQCQYANGYDRSAMTEMGAERQSAGCRDRQVRTAPVGSYQPNGVGLHDVLGNVWEWVDDCWNGTYEDAPTDGSSWYTGDCSLRVLRGGSWLTRPEHLRSAARLWNGTGRRFRDAGFRVARTIY